MKKFALIVAGGNGSRMNSAVPKQFAEIAGKPVLMHTIEAFCTSDPAFSFVVVLPESEFETWHLLCQKFNFNIKHKVVGGGITRFQSVKNGLETVSENGIVFIHDGVRPLVSAQTINNCYKMAAEKGNALPVISPSESVRFADERKNSAVDRTKYFLVQTPQTFKVSLIKKAFKQEYTEKFTDDASVLENTGKEIFLVEGNRENIKITYPEDMKFAAAYLKDK